MLVLVFVMCNKLNYNDDAWTTKKKNHGLSNFYLLDIIYRVIKRSNFYLLDVIDGTKVHQLHHKVIYYLVEIIYIIS